MGRTMPYPYNAIQEYKREKLLLTPYISYLHCREGSSLCRVASSPPVQVAGELAGAAGALALPL